MVNFDELSGKGRPGVAEVRIGSRVRTFDGFTCEVVGISGVYDEWLWLDNPDENEPFTCHRSFVRCIPNTVTIEVNRKDAEYMAEDEWADDRLRRIADACREVLDAQAIQEWQKRIELDRD